MSDIPIVIPPHARSPFPGTKGRACILARVSGQSDPRTLSLETQGQGCVDAVVDHGCWLTMADIRFERVTGVNSLAFRDDLLEILEEIEAGKYQFFAIHDPDRLVRGPEVLNVVHRVEEAGCTVFLNGKVSVPSDDRDLLLMFAGFASKKEARQIAERTTRVKSKIAERGDWVGGGSVRYGYLFDKQTRARTAHPEHAAVVVRIFELIAAGRSTIYVAKLLNAEGVPSPGTLRASRRNPSPKEYLWSAARVGFIVREPTYIGLAYRNRHRYRLDGRGRIMRKGKRKILDMVPRDEWTLCPAARTEALISEDLWRRANAALEDNNTTKKKADATRQAGRFYMLRGHLFCGECRQRMHPVHYLVGGKAKGHRYGLYRCKSKNNPFHGHPVCRGLSVHQAKVERKIKPMIEALISDPDFVDGEIDKAYAPDGKESTLIRQLEHARESIVKLEGEIEGYVADLGDHESGSRARRAISGKMTLLEGQIEALEQQAEDLAVRLAAATDRDRLRLEHKARVRAVCDHFRAIGELTDRDAWLTCEALGLRFYYLRGEVEMAIEDGGALPMGDTVHRPSTNRGRWKKDRVGGRRVPIDAAGLLAAR